MGELFISLPLSRVSETLRPLPLRPTGGGAPFDCGEAIIRGEPTPVYDLGVLASGKRSTHHRWVTLKTQPRVVAVAVDRVHGVKTLDEAATLGPLLTASAAAAELTGDVRAALLEARRLPPEVSA